MSFYSEPCGEIYQWDCRKVLAEMPGESVQCVVTSPPFWGLRKYSGEQDMIWGDNHCEHEWIKTPPRRKRKQSDVVDMRSKEATNASAIDLPFTDTCSLCGAWKGQLGLEPTPEMYVSHIVEIFREVRRVLRKDGVAFLNIGDSYVGSALSGGVSMIQDSCIRLTNMPLKRGKPKDLCLIPFRLAIALQSDGWWLRSVIIWSKPNPMPESVTDRPTESHEYLLMLTKSGTIQYWTHRDLPGIRVRPKADYRWVNELTNEEVDAEPPNWKDKITCPECEGTGKVNIELGWYTIEGKCEKCAGKGEIRLWKRVNLWKGHDYYWDADAVRSPVLPETLIRDKYPHRRRIQLADYGIEKFSGNMATDAMEMSHPSGRNIRTVWEFPTQSYAEAHFAVFPEKLPELCIKAATPEVGSCSTCGAPWVRVIESQGITARQKLEQRGPSPYSQSQPNNPQGLDYKGGHDNNMRLIQTVGWRPTCSCNAGKAPSVVLDLFCGAGTTPKVAKELGRRFIGIDISEEYCELSKKRVEAVPLPMF